MECVDKRSHRDVLGGWHLLVLPCLLQRVHGMLAGNAVSCQNGADAVRKLTQKVGIGWHLGF